MPKSLLMDPLCAACNHNTQTISLKNMATCSFSKPTHLETALAGEGALEGLLPEGEKRWLGPD